MPYYEYWRDLSKQKIDSFPHNSRFEEHIHKGLEIQCCIENKMQVFQDGKEYVVHAGEIFFISSGMPHGIIDTGTNFALLIPPQHLDVWFQCVEGMYPADPVIKGEYAKILTPLILDIQNYYNQSPVKLHNKLYEILDICLDALHFVKRVKNKKENEYYDIISKCMQYIDENYTQNITLVSLAAKFGYNKNYLSEILHRELKMNFRDFINQIRLEKLTLNYNRELSLDAQLEQYGFISRQTFYRAFKKQYNTSPSKYFL